MPGTGKTATVKECIAALQKNKKIPQFDFVEINGMKLNEPAQVYAVLWKHLDGAGKACSAQTALKNLKGYFEDAPRPTVVLLDELDALLQKKQSILYHFFEWTGHESAKLIVISIANTMDLPERLLINRIASRMGSNRINFIPYQYSQLQAIILHRLAPYAKWFNPDALEFCCRKVSSVSGDARRAIAFATRAVDFILAQTRMKEGPKAKPKPNSISFEVMRAVLGSTFTGSPVWAIKNCNKLQLMLLESVAMAWKNQINLYDTTFYNVLHLVPY